MGLLIEFPKMKDEKECSDFLDASGPLMEAAPFMKDGQIFTVMGDGRRVTFTVKVE